MKAPERFTSSVGLIVNYIRLVNDLSLLLQSSLEQMFSRTKHSVARIIMEIKQNVSRGLYLIYIDIIGRSLNRRCGAIQEAAAQTRHGPFL